MDSRWDWLAVVAEAMPEGAMEAISWMSGGVVGAIATTLLASKVLTKLTARSSSSLDDLLLSALRMPVAVTWLLLGASQAIEVGVRSATTVSVLQAVISTVLIALWGRAVLTIGSYVLQRAAYANDGVGRFVRPQTLPVFYFAFQIISYAVLGYALLGAWGIDPTAVLASLGIVGLAIGFAAQQSLSDLFAGVMIIADSPFKIGDFLTLDDGSRGKVVRIGIRSTRMLTVRQVEIVVPNSKMSTAMIVNESGGPNPRQRLDLPVGVAYGTHVAQVKRVLVAAVKDVPGVVTDAPDTPRARLVGFGASSVDYMVLIWVDDPAGREDVRDRALVAIYEALGEHSIEIPYTKQDVYLHMVDRGSSDGDGSGA